MNARHLASILLVVLAVVGCGGSDGTTGAAPSTPATSTTATVTPTPTPSTSTPAIGDLVRAWEPDEAIQTSSWYRHVQGFESAAGELFVLTDLTAAGETSERICGGYSLFTRRHPDIHTITVQGPGGQQLAQCGPGA